MLKKATLIQLNLILERKFGTMKTTLKLLFFCLLLTFAACEKDSDNIKHSLLTKTELLLKKPWIVQEVRTLETNTLTKYERGAAGNDINYDNEVLTFTSATEGTLKDIYGVTSAFNWTFTNPAQTKMQLTIHYATEEAVLQYNMVAISNDNFSATLNYATHGVNVLSSVRRSWQP